VLIDFPAATRSARYNARMIEDLPSWWSRERHADRRPVLIDRGRIKRALQGWFETQGFTEVECGALVASPGNEAHLHAFETELRTTAGEGRKIYLHTSPEFACKKLLAAGETKIFDFARVCRNRERGRLHAPEFTMLEWYRANEPYETVIVDTLAMLRLAAETTGIGTMSFKGRGCNPRADADRLTVAEAFSKHTGIDLMPTLSETGEGNRDALAEQAAHADFEIADNDTWADIFSKILVARVEPKLGIGVPTIIYEYPRCEAALARASPHDARAAERFELYVCGVELANGFGELTDPVEQRKRFVAEMDEKQRVYGERYPLDEDFLSALAHVPPASGVALGFDRLVMLSTAARTIDDVLWTPCP
jgi:lysyl-tRNA synthetase class 2